MHYHSLNNERAQTDVNYADLERLARGDFLQEKKHF